MSWGKLNYKLKYGKVTRITEFLEGLVCVCGDRKSVV